MHIRNAHKNDYPSICNLVKTKEELFLIYPAARFPLTIHMLEQLALKRLALTVVELEKRIIGFANLYAFTPDKEVFIGNVIIEDQQRGSGTGKMLIQHMLDIAFIELNVANVNISVFNENTPALNLYYSLGFTPYAFDQRVSPDGNKVILIHNSLNKSDRQNINPVSSPTSET
jgi:ribosomal protein S18 acetylase RimI-like enzyme